MIYFNIELTQHDFSKSEYIRRTYKGKSKIIQNDGRTIAFSIDGLSSLPYDSEMIKYVLTGDFYISEPYQENK
jgi:hypothetical protein